MGDLIEYKVVRECLDGKRGKRNKMILSIMVYTFNSYKEDSYAAIGRAA